MKIKSIIGFGFHIAGKTCQSRLPVESNRTRSCLHHDAIPGERLIKKWLVGVKKVLRIDLPKKPLPAGHRKQPQNAAGLNTNEHGVKPPGGHVAMTSQLAGLSSHVESCSQHNQNIRPEFYIHKKECVVLAYHNSFTGRYVSKLAFSYAHCGNHRDHGSGK